MQDLNPKELARVAAYRSTYRAQLAEWPVQAEERILETKTGHMHLLVFGPASAPPLLMLHGGGGTSLGWIYQAAALSVAHRVYALDLPGHSGLSVTRTPLRTLAQVMAMIDEVLDALRISRLDLLGISLGGAYAGLYAIKTPARVQRLVMIAPAPLLVPLRFSFYLHNFPLLFGSLGVAGFLRWLGPKENAGQEPYEQRLKTMIRWAKAARRHFGLPNVAGFEWPPILRDEQLRGLSVPTLIIIGEHEVVYDARKGLARAALIPKVRTALIAGAGHDVAWSQPERLNAAITEFLV